MKINFVLPFYPWNPVGGFRVVYEYANRLSARGHEISIFHAIKLRQTVPDKGFNRILQQLYYIRCAYTRPKLTWQYIDPRIRMFYVPDLTANYIRDGDIVVATAWQTAEYLWEYPKSKGRKFYLIQGYEIWAGSKERVDATWLLPIHKVVIASWLYELGRAMGIDGQVMMHIPNGIDHDKYRLVNSIKTRRKRVAMMYSSIDWKGAPDGVEALEIAKASHSNLEAVLFGVCPRPKFLPQWIEYIKEPPQNLLVQDVYNGSSIYLCPSWTEGWCLPNAEAMACGCAVVSTDNSGVRDYAIDGRTALLSPIKKPDLLAKNLVRLLDDDEYRCDLAQNGYHSIKFFTWDRSTDLFENYINQIVYP
jgi:glycosyltransferase involved in cell wall biosynthesis